jgi:Zn-dependent peptidase ImmA (M78 family)
MHPGRPLLVDAEVKINKRTPTNGFATAAEETEANRFAAALLMPAAEIERILQSMKLPTEKVGQAIIARLHVHFGVSEAAMQFRLMNLGLFLPH